MSEDADQTEFWLVREDGDIESFDSYDAAFEKLTAAVKRDIAEHGEEDARESGVLHAYGYSITVMRGGTDVTQDWRNNEPCKPLSMD
ncbi:hypothetical protein [Streptomyces sp. 4F14]|uniref:hypothetical protein n=1 Tax=Streptomyces sp. 4F14 TaxID=3394380 RepID=UPI003A836959